MYQTVNEECIAKLVDDFYGKVRQDQILGPIFMAAIGSDWTLHLERMNAFWASVLLAAGTYKGNPMIAQLRLPRLTEPHFERAGCTCGAKRSWHSVQMPSLRCSSKKRR